VKLTACPCSIRREARAGRSLGHVMPRLVDDDSASAIDLMRLLDLLYIFRCVSGVYRPTVCPRMHSASAVSGCSGVLPPRDDER